MENDGDRQAAGRVGGGDRQAAVRAAVGDRVVRRGVLVREGFSDRTLRRAVDRGLVRRVGHGLYAPADVTAEVPLERVLAATGGVAAGPTAALVHGWELAHPPRLHHVLVPRGRRRDAPPGCRLHRADLACGEAVDERGVPVTSALRTVLDCLRWLPLAEGVAAADSALRCGAATAHGLQEALDRLPRSRGTAPVRRGVALVDASAESVLESLARVLLTQGGLVPPRTQHVVRDELGRHVARVDFAWPDARLVVEVDGPAWHSTREQVRRDRARTNRLVLLGWRVLRFGWEEVVARPDVVLRGVRAALTDAARAG